MKNVFGFATWVARHALVLLVAVSLAGCLEEDKQDEEEKRDLDFSLFENEITILNLKGSLNK